jgi:hypothetical protein
MHAPIASARFSRFAAAPSDAVRLQRRAAPLQAEGIPTLCQDVPPIPPYTAA